MNLVSDGWIPVIDDVGKKRVLPLKQVLLSAHRIRRIAGTTPLETVAIFRLLLAVLYRVAQPDSEISAVRILQRGRFPERNINQYLTKWKHRFNLFDPNFPFFQWAHPPDNLKPRNANRLFIYLSSGTRGTLHSHIHDKSVVQLTPPAAALALLLAQSFSVAGGNSGRPGRNYRHTPALRQTNFIIHGQSLFETLWLMLFPVELLHDLEPFLEKAVPADVDCPVWERDHPEIPQRTAPQGPTDSLTYPARLIRLVPDDDGTVRRTIFSQGLLTDDNVPMFDPMAAVRTVTQSKTQQMKGVRVKLPDGFLSEFSMFEPDPTIPTHPIWPVYRRWLKTAKHGLIDPKRSIFNAIGVKTGAQPAKAAELIKSFNHYLPIPATVFLEPSLFQSAQTVVEYVQLRQEFGIRSIKKGLETVHPSKRSLFAPATANFHKNLTIWMSTRLPVLIHHFDPIDVDTVFRQIFRQCIANFPIAAHAVATDRYQYLCKHFSPTGETDER